MLRNKDHYFTQNAIGYKQYSFYFKKHCIAQRATARIQNALIMLLFDVSLGASFRRGLVVAPTPGCPQFHNASFARVFFVGFVAEASFTPSGLGFPNS